MLVQRYAEPICFEFESVTFIDVWTFNQNVGVALLTTRCGGKNSVRVDGRPFEATEEK